MVDVIAVSVEYLVFHHFMASFQSCHLVQNQVKKFMDHFAGEKQQSRYLPEKKEKYSIIIIHTSINYIL